jgi:hypothetical protein
VPPGHHDRSQLPAAARPGRHRAPPRTGALHRPLFLVAGILASTSRPAGIDIAEVRRQHAAVLAELEHLTVRCLDLPAVRREPDTFIHLLQVLLALRDEPIWQSHLTGLANGEYELLHPRCGRDLFAVIDDHGAVLTEGYTPSERRRQTPSTRRTRPAPPVPRSGCTNWPSTADNSTSPA